MISVFISQPAPDTQTWFWFSSSISQYFHSLIFICIVSCFNRDGPDTGLRMPARSSHSSDFASGYLCGVSVNVCTHIQTEADRAGINQTLKISKWNSSSTAGLQRPLIYYTDVMFGAKLLLIRLETAPETNLTYTQCRSQDTATCLRVSNVTGIVFYSPKTNIYV